MRQSPRNKIKIFVLCFYSLIAWANQSDLLVEELSQLRNSLSAKDESRKEVSLRLADAHFDKALALSGSGQPQQAESAFRSALDLYQEVLNGGRGCYEPPTGSQKITIEFQVARALSELGENAKADTIWRKLVDQHELSSIRREAALRLAESAEKNETGYEDARRYYRLSLEMCEGVDACNYAHYRLSWLFRRERKYSDAIREMELALWDSKGQVQEQPLGELVVLMSLQGGNGVEELAYLEQLSEKTHRFHLLLDLANSFFANGNRIAGTHVLEFENSKRPSLLNRLRLIEENYGLRNFEKVQNHLGSIRLVTDLVAPDFEKTETLLRRLLVQFDGERTTSTGYIEPFQRLSDLYLHLFPTHPNRFKIIEGWMASETNPKRQLEKTAVWMANAGLKLTQTELVQIRRWRLGAAERLMDHELVENEASLLVSLVQAKELHPILFVQALAQFKQNKTSQALSIFQRLAGPPILDGIDPLRAQQISLEILVGNKDYPGVVAQVEKWTRDGALRERYRDRMKDMVQTAEDAKFEWAVSWGDSPKALDFFSVECFQKRHLPKSCENAKVLAYKLKNESLLIKILEAASEEPSEELCAEYEAAGFFEQAAKIREKWLTTKKEKSIPLWLRVAMLYELAEDNDSSGRILKKILESKIEKIDLVTEGSFYDSLKANHLIGMSLWRLPWSGATRLRLANDLEAQKQGNLITRQHLLQSKDDLGAGWQAVVIDRLKELDSAARKISFYGRNGEKRFRQRNEALKTLVAEGEKYLSGASDPVRLEILELSMGAMEQMARDIVGTPIPAEVDEATRKEVMAKMAEMAIPYQKRASDYQRLLEKDRFVSGKKNTQPLTESFGMSAKTYLERLHEDPENTEALIGLKGFYELKGNARLAAYFDGRLAQNKTKGGL